MVAPEPVDDADEDWFGRAYPRSRYVYPDHARLWLTARTLQDAGAIDSPGKLRSLVESVYGEDVVGAIPEGLLGTLFDAEGRAGAERGAANFNVLDFTRGYVRDAGPWDSDVRTPTRLDDQPQVTLRLARAVNGRIEPYAHDAAADEPWRAWRLSEVNVSARRVGGEAVPPVHGEAARVAKECWTRFDSEKTLVVLERADEAKENLTGAVLSANESSPALVCLGYDKWRGVELR